MPEFSYLHITFQQNHANRKIHGSFIVADPDSEIGVGDTLIETQLIEELNAHGGHSGVENSALAEWKVPLESGRIDGTVSSNGDLLDIVNLPLRALKRAADGFIRFVSCAGHEFPQ